MKKHILIAAFVGMGLIAAPQTSHAGFFDAITETVGTVFGNTNPYEEYQNGDKGLIGYMFWHTIAKTPESINGYLARKALPYNGLIDVDELQSLDFVRVEFDKNLIMADQFVLSDSGQYLWHGSTSIDNYAPVGYGILAKKERDTIVPVFVGEMSGGVMNGYGIKFKTVSNAYGITTYVEYEGEFWHNIYHGNGVLYKIANESQLGNELPHIWTSSGHFHKGKMDGYFYIYDEDSLEYEGRYSDGIRS